MDKSNFPTIYYKMSTTHVPATPENVAAAIADLNAPLPVGARRMTEAERQLHVSNVLEALFKQSKVSVCICAYPFLWGSKVEGGVQEGEGEALFLQTRHLPSYGR